MPNKMLMTGVVLFGGSVLLVLTLLVTHGGAQKSQQFEVLGRLLQGGHGALMRALLITAFVGLGLGAALSFTAIQRADARQRQQCHAACVQRGFAKGVMGLSAGRDASGRSYKVCKCSGNLATESEIDPQTLSE